MSFSSVRGTSLEIIPTHISSDLILDEETTKTVVSSYLALKGETRQKVQVAIQRLGQGLMRRRIGDKAVELSIALETLLGDGGNNEMTHKIKTRCARFLGGSNDERRVIHDLVSKTYDIRSKLIHNGQDVSKSQQIAGAKVSPQSVIDQTAKVCADVIKKVLELGEIPDWTVFDIKCA